MVILFKLRAVICAAICVFIAGGLAPLRAQVVITEFLAENDEGITDADGDHEDWIELHNPTETAVDLAGWRLTDNPGALGKWVFPSVTLAAGSRLIVFASEKDRRVAGEELHTNFKLDVDGESLVLSKPDGSIASQFVAFPKQTKDFSFGPGTLVAAEDLITSTSAGRMRVPSDASLDPAWTTQGFNDAAWATATSRIGYQTGTTPPGLPIAYWTFDDVTANEIAGGPAVTLNGATYDAGVPGAIADGKSLHFNRAASTTATAALDVSETAYTASMWFRTSSPTTGIFAVHAGTLGANGHDRHIYLLNGNIGVRVHSGGTMITTGMNFADGAWHHVAHIYGASVGGQKLYVDGQLVLTGTKAQSDFPTQERVTIGFSNDATGFQFHEGEIDDVAIWSEPLGVSAIQSLAAGTNPMLLSGFDPYIGTDVETAMRNVNGSLYLRLPFAVNRAIPYTQATLRMRYDDGFVAYVDGVEVARRNAPAAPVFNSTAPLDRAADTAITQETINISASVNLLGNGSHVLAIHALNEATGSNEFLLNAELSAAALSQQTAIFLDPPTPGQPNATGFAGFVADTVFAPKRGVFDAPQNVVITTATPGASIAYTLDGSDPSPSNGVQVLPANATSVPSGAINVAKTQAIRAMAYKAGVGLKPTNIDSHTYIFPNQVALQPSNPAGFNLQWSGRVADYGMDQSVVNTTLRGYGVRDALQALPSVSLTCRNADFFDAPNGIYYNTALRGLFGEKKVSIEWINPDGSPGWHVQAGARMHGNSSRGHSFTPKHTVRLKFRDEYGEGKFNRDLFGKGAADKFDELVLRACSTDSFPAKDGDFSDGEQRWNNDKATYLRDQFMRDTLNALGWPNCHGRYCHLYINGLYWGLYNLTERPTAEFFSETFGSSDEDWDVIKDVQEVNDGDRVAWDAMFAINNDSMVTHEERAQRLLGNNPDGTRNPAYPVYLHLPSFIDYMIVHIAAGAEDWHVHNFWAGRRKGPDSDGFHFVIWDQEISNDSLTRPGGLFSDNPFETVGDPAIQTRPDRAGPPGLYDTLRRAPSFRQKFRERIHELFFNGGALSPAANKARWTLRMNELDKAIVAESARWGDANGEGARTRETHWINTMAFMMTPKTGYFDAISPIQIKRFRNAGIYPAADAPMMSQQGGTIEPGFTLRFTTDQPLAYYTLDGTDPMDPSGEPSATAVAYNGGVYPMDIVPQGAFWHHLVTRTAPPAAWDQLGFDDLAWPEAQAQFGYGDGDEITAISDGGNSAARNITMYFRYNFTLDARPMTAKLHLLRDDGAVVYLNGKEVVRSNMHPTKPIVWSTTASTNATGVDESTYFYPYVIDPADLIQGENVMAVEVHQVSGTSDDLSFDARLEVTTAIPTDAVILNDATLVKVRARGNTGEWTGMNSAYFAMGSEPVSGTNVVVSELHYHPANPMSAEELAVSSDPDDFEFIELLNIGTRDADFSGVTFSTGIEFHFPSGYVLAPGERCVVAKNAAAFAARYQGRAILGVFEGGTGLSNSGEGIALTRGPVGSLESIRAFSYDDVAPWPVAADGGGPSLVLLNPGANPNHSSPASWTASSVAGGFATAALPIGTSRYQEWRAAYGRELRSGADDDGDGISNTLEFVFMANPLQRDASVLPVARMQDIGGRRVLTLTYRHRRVEPGLELIVETSSDLKVWSGQPAVFLETSTDHGDGSVTETWRCATTPLDGRPQFMRVRAIVEP